MLLSYPYDRSSSLHLRLLGLGCFITGDGGWHDEDGSANMLVTRLLNALIGGDKLNFEILPNSRALVRIKEVIEILSFSKIAIINKRNEKS